MFTFQLPVLISWHECDIMIAGQEEKETLKITNGFTTKRI
jgi:hypothetical protein